MVNTSKTTIQSVARAVAILRALAWAPPGMRRADLLAQTTGIGKATVYHILSTLCADGLLMKHGSPATYQFGPLFDLLAEATYESRQVPDFVNAATQSLAAETGETSYFSVRRRGEIEIVACAQGTELVRVGTPSLNFRGAEHARASGKLFLALDKRMRDELITPTSELARLTDRTIVDPAELQQQLTTIQDQQYAIERGEFVKDVACIASPVWLLGGLYGAIAVSVPIHRLSEREKLITDAVSSKAISLTKRLESLES